MGRKRKGEGEELGIVNLNTAEILHRIKEDERIRIYNKKQVKRNKYYSKPIEVNTNKPFIKCMIDRLDKTIDELSKSSSTFLALNILALYICPTDNLVKIDRENTKYKIKDLAAKMGITRQQASAHIKKLKELNIVAEVEMANGKFYAINPEYYCRNTKIPERVLNAFDTTKKKKPTKKTKKED